MSPQKVQQWVALCSLKEIKKFQKSLKKTLDKLKKMCYNKYVIKREKNKNFSKKL